MIKQDEVAFIKTTGEAVYILDLNAGEYVQVRRPIMGQNGVQHQIDTFRPNELETRDEQRAQLLADREEMRKYVPKYNPAPAPSDTGFSTN